MKKIAFIGLGVMGFPMAGLLADAGFSVTVYNRTESRAKEWLDRYTGQMAETPEKAAKGCDLVLSCVGNDQDVEAVWFGERGILKGLSQGAVGVDHTTTSADIARRLNQACTHQGAAFLDAPVSGGEIGAQKGILTVMMGGDKKIFNQVKPVISTYAKAVTRLGGVGSGQQCKMVNQICLAGLIQGLAEGLSFAKRAGLDGSQVLSVLSLGAAQSWQMTERGETMLQDQYDFGFAVNWMRKDLAICLEEARKNGAHLPVAALVDQFYAQVQALGGGRWDTSSLMKLLNHRKDDSLLE
ncbi:NAD(P)-dependent oxidoreductase [Magnetococcales bacterium HHB-1]